MECGGRTEGRGWWVGGWMDDAMDGQTRDRLEDGRRTNGRNDAHAF